MVTETCDHNGHLVWRKDPPSSAHEPIFSGVKSWYSEIKFVAEFAFAAVLVVLTGPLLLLAACLIKLTSRGPVLYTQVRLGRFGRPFTIFKLRTMRHNCEALSGPQWSTAGDCRITPLGQFLRRTHIDELPQLWNVLRGDMSLIGPRPERPEFVPQLERAIPCYRDRLQVRPGITGLAQVQLPPDTDLTSVRRKLAHDLYYVRSLGWWLDMRILLITGFTFLGLPTDTVCKFLRMPGGSQVEREYETVASVTPVLPELQPA